MKGGPPSEENEAPSRNGASFFFASSVAPTCLRGAARPKERGQPRDVKDVHEAVRWVRGDVEAGERGRDRFGEIIGQPDDVENVERPSLVISAGQASVPQARAGFVPIDASAPSLQPSQALQPVRAEKNGMTFRRRTPFSHNSPRMDSIGAWAGLPSGRKQCQRISSGRKSHGSPRERPRGCHERRDSVRRL